MAKTFHCESTTILLLNTTKNRASAKECAAYEYEHEEHEKERYEGGASSFGH